MDDFYLIAEVQNTYSSDGSVVIKSFSDFSERFFELEEVIIDFFGKSKVLKIDFVQEADNELVIKFKRFNSEEDVRFLLGKKLYVDKQNLFKLPNDTFYIHDLIGCEVYLGSMFFGKLNDVLNLSSHDVYVITTQNGKEIMIPAVENFIDKFDVNEKKLYLDSNCKIFEDEDYDED